MNSAAMLDNMVREWKAQGRTKTEIIVLQAEAMLGWPYAWGAAGQDCTPEKRTYFMNRDVIGAGDAELIRKRCQVLNGGNALCVGCKYYPGGARTRIQDCQGFVKELHKAVGITLKGGGATSMYNDNSNWSAKGPIAEMPDDAVCCVFKQAGNKMDHVGQHIGGGDIIHCSGEVKRGKISEKGWTHYAIPKGLEGAVPVSGATSLPVLRKGSRGEYVTMAQNLLLQHGYSCGSAGADGIFGSDTLYALKSFQLHNGLEMDGVIGPATWAALQMAAETETYTVHIPGLALYVAEALKGQYDGATITKEEKE